MCYTAPPHRHAGPVGCQVDINAASFTLVWALRTAQAVFLGAPAGRGMFRRGAALCTQHGTARHTRAQHSTQGHRSACQQQSDCKSLLATASPPPKHAHLTQRPSTSASPENELQLLHRVRSPVHCPQFCALHGRQCPSCRPYPLLHASQAPSGVQLAQLASQVRQEPFTTMAGRLPIVSHFTHSCQSSLQQGARRQAVRRWACEPTHRQRPAASPASSREGQGSVLLNRGRHCGLG